MNYLNYSHLPKDIINKILDFSVGTKQYWMLQFSNVLISNNYLKFIVENRNLICDSINLDITPIKYEIKKDAIINFKNLNKSSNYNEIKIRYSKRCIMFKNKVKIYILTDNDLKIINMKISHPS